MCVCFALLRSVLRSGLFCLSPPCLCSLALSPCFTRIILHAQHVCYLLCSWLFPFCVISCFLFLFSHSLCRLSLFNLYLCFFSTVLCSLLLFLSTFVFICVNYQFKCKLGAPISWRRWMCSDKRQVLLSCHLTTLSSPLNALKMLLMCLCLCACLCVSTRRKHLNWPNTLAQMPEKPLMTNSQVHFEHFVIARTAELMRSLVRLVGAQTISKIGNGCFTIVKYVSCL